MSNKQKCSACGKSCSRHLNICPTCSPARTNVSHTPGPWEIEERGFHAVRVTRDDPKTGKTELIADVWNNDGEVPADANARLIAAAPDLLHALQTLMSWIDSKPLPCTVAVLDAWADELHHRENRARAAIAKAEAA